MPFDYSRLVQHLESNPLISDSKKKQEPFAYNGHKVVTKPNGGKVRDHYGNVIEVGKSGTVKCGKSFYECKVMSFNVPSNTCQVYVYNDDDHNVTTKNKKIITVHAGNVYMIQKIYHREY